MLDVSVEYIYLKKEQNEKRILFTFREIDSFKNVAVGSFSFVFL